MTRLVIGLSGFKKSGKSKTAERLVARHGFRVSSPIDPGKHMGVALGWSESCMFGPSECREEPHPYLLKPDGTPLTGREFLDPLGEAIRAIHPDLLLDASMRGDGDLVNESCRALNELERVRALGGKLIRRKGGIYTGSVLDREMAAIPDSYFDACIPRLDTLEQLYAVIDVLVDGWKAEVGR